MAQLALDYGAERDDVRRAMGISSAEFNELVPPDDDDLEDDAEPPADDDAGRCTDIIDNEIAAELEAGRDLSEIDVEGLTARVSAEYDAFTDDGDHP
ncbi:MAG: hypothetical protein U5O39_03405 [Gammaproteobacteria bacterium]|nr:hypothetical protein [Gammaproteobacteria bacterium]